MINDPYDPVPCPDYSAAALFEMAAKAYQAHAPNIEARSFLRQAANKGHGHAQYLMGVEAYSDLRFDDAAQWFEKSAAHVHEKQGAAQEFLNSLTEAQNAPRSLDI